MYLQRDKSKGKKDKIYSSTLLCHKYRDGGMPKTKVLANLSHLPENIILSIENILKRSEDTLIHLGEIVVKAAIDYGLVFLLIHLMQKLRISEVLHKVLPEHASNLELLIIGKIVTRGSKLGIYNWIKRQPEIAKRLNIDVSNLKVKDLYYSLGRLSDNRKAILKKWFLYHKSRTKDIYLYDITSTYFEGTQNVLSAFGYNRDGKKGKLQICIGLITDQEGFPLKIEVFEGNTLDQKTVISQLMELKKSFKAENIILVGDRGMKIRYNLDQLEEAEREGIQYITGLEHSEIETLIKNDIIQLSLFSKDLAEINHDGQRYILSINPDLQIRELYFLRNRKSELEKLIGEIQSSWKKRHTINLANIEKLKNGDKNKKLVTSFSEKKIDNYKFRVEFLCRKYKMTKLYEFVITNDEFAIMYKADQYLIKEQLAGKYVLNSTVEKEKLDKIEIREKYKLLQKVEHAFRDFKSDNIQVRPVFHRNEAQTRGHVLCSMFSYAIIQSMESKIFPWLKKNNKSRKEQLAFDDILEELKDIKLCKLNIGMGCEAIKITELNPMQKETLKLFGMKKIDIEKVL